MRIVALTHDWHVIGDLDVAKLLSAKVIEEVNGEHALVVETLQELAKGDRMLWRDGTGSWHEYVVYGISSRRIGPSAVSHRYYCPWSLQLDLMETTTTAMPGTGGTPASATTALQGALQGTSRWTIGTVEPETTGSASFWRMSGWEAMQKLVSVWGGEVRADITIGSNWSISRSVSLLAHIGSSTPTRRYDYGRDVTGFERDVLEQPWTCRVIPLGAAEEAEGGGYGRKITIGDANGGVDYLENPDTVALTRKPDGNGGWEYPTQHVENPEMQTPADLKAWALAHLDDWTTPRVSYTLEVLQLAQAGAETGVACGDEVIVVDSGFGSEGVRLRTRAVRVDLDLLDPTATKVTMSNVQRTLSTQLNEVAQVSAEAVTLVEKTNDYLRTIIRDDDSGTLVVHVGGEFGALVNADGSFDIVPLTWVDDTPMVGDWWTRMSAGGFEYVPREHPFDAHFWTNGVDLEVGYLQGRFLTWDPTNGLRFVHWDEDESRYITDLRCATDGTLYSSKTFGWFEVATTSGTTRTALDLTHGIGLAEQYEYSELLVVATYGTTFAASVVVPVAALTRSDVDWYLGGWSNGSDYNAACKLSLEAIAPYSLRVGGSSVSGNWTVYGR